MGWSQVSTLRIEFGVRNIAGSSKKATDSHFWNQWRETVSFNLFLIDHQRVCIRLMNAVLQNWVGHVHLKSPRDNGPSYLHVRPLPLPYVCLDLYMQYEKCKRDATDSHKAKSEKQLSNNNNNKTISNAP